MKPAYSHQYSAKGKSEMSVVNVWSSPPRNSAREESTGGPTLRLLDSSATTHREKLRQQGARDHVAERAGRFVGAGAAADAERLGRSDLDVTDVVAASDRLERRVADPKPEPVLVRLFAE